VVATDFAPNRELVVEGRNGLLVENGPAALAQAMLRFVQDRAFLAECRGHAQAMRQGTPWNEIVELYEQTVYLPLVQKRDRPAQAIMGGRA
jgi:glycosyltransferase involved in cell wall biosynthesis